MSKYGKVLPAEIHRIGKLVKMDLLKMSSFVLCNQYNFYCNSKLPTKCSCTSYPVFYLHSPAYEVGVHMGGYKTTLLEYLTIFHN